MPTPRTLALRIHKWLRPKPGKKPRYPEGTIASEAIKIELERRRELRKKGGKINVHLYSDVYWELSHLESLRKKEVIWEKIPRKHRKRLSGK